MNDRKKTKAAIFTALLMAVVGILVGYAYVDYRKNKGQTNGSPSIMGIAVVFALIGAVLGYTKYDRKPAPETV